MSSDHIEQPPADSDFETLYNGAINSDQVGPIARVTAQKVVERFFAIQVDNDTTDLTRKIALAAGENNYDLIMSLTDELRAAKETENQRHARLIKISDEFSFNELLHAFPADLKDLTYEMALLVIKQVEEGLKQSKSRPSRTAGMKRESKNRYLIQKGGESIEVVPNVGRRKTPSSERDFYEFMGFTLSEDGRSVIPENFTNKEGNVIENVSKKSIIEDLLAGNALWTDKGYSIALITPEVSGAAA
jgi:hypothetical protein